MPGTGQAAVPSFLGAEPTCTTRAILAFHTKAALLSQEDVVFSVSEQETSHINVVTQLPFPTQVSQTPWSPFARYGLFSQAGGSDCTPCCLKCSFFFLFSFFFSLFFFNTFWFLSQSKMKPGLQGLKKQHRNGELTKNQNSEFSVSSVLHTSIW